MYGKELIKLTIHSQAMSSNENVEVLVHMTNETLLTAIIKKAKEQGLKCCFAYQRAGPSIYPYLCYRFNERSLNSIFGSKRNHRNLKILSLSEFLNKTGLYPDEHVKED